MLTAMSLGALCALSFGPLEGAKIFGMTVFNLFDFATSNVLMPVGGVFISVFAGHFVKRATVERQLAPAPRALVKAIVFSLRWVSPAAISVIFVAGLL